MVQNGVNKILRELSVDATFPDGLKNVILIKKIKLSFNLFN